MEIIIASNNKNKIKEIQQIIGGQFVLKTLKEIGIVEDIPETGNTFKENAFQKANYVYTRFNMPCLADDSGICVDALKGAPGVISARYAGEHKNDLDNNNLLLRNLSGVSNRKAHFNATLCFMDNKGMAHYFEGITNGLILETPIGTEGFGYDPIFKPNGFDLSYAQIDAATKNTISHRAKALALFNAYINTL